MIESDRTAILAILSRWSRLWQTNAQLQQQKAQLESQIAQTAAGLVNTETALKVFGFDVSQDGVWAHLNELFGREIQTFMAQENAQAEFERQQFDAAVQSFNDLLATDSPNKKPPMPTIREIALMRLREAGNEGARAKTIREYVQSTYGVEIHEKTVGMTLYRLLKEGLVRREGHVWFFVPHGAETKTPGVSAPGVFE
jgi:hypothetical protein